MPLPRKLRSAGFAFLISLVIPGSGQVYCGKKLRGVSTFVIFLLAAFGVVALNTESVLRGASLRYLAAIYIFSFLDAYYTALEVNVEKDPPAYQNPRVAAVLNLLTNGF
ncbi:MAG: hypothetical protein HY508_00400, partial [Acidobacteria bacterium]|nr:hypothetical protein [Acidobacteriota bacterium]